VVDITHPNAREQAQAVQRTLKELEVGDIPIVTALNKIDRLPDFDSRDNPLAAYPNTVGISATKRFGLGVLLERVQHALHESLTPLDVRVPYKDGQLISIFHEHGTSEKIEHEEKTVHIQGRIPARLAARFKPYAVKPKRKRLQP